MEIRDQGVHMGDSSMFGIVNGDVSVSGPPEAPRQEYQVTRRRLLPLTESMLSIASSLLGIGSVVGLWQALTRVWATLPFRPGGAAATSDPGLPPGLLVAVLCSLGVVVLMSGRRLAKHRLMAFTTIPLLPVLAGVSNRRGKGQLALLRLGGQCVTCGGRLRFYNRAETWDFDAQGKRHVTSRLPVAECRRNPRHVWSVDIADRGIG